MVPLRHFRCFCAGFSALGLTVALLAGAPGEETIARAREFLGGERALSAVTSLRYVGRMEISESADGTPKSVSGTIELIFQKPDQQRITQVVGKTKVIIGLANGEAWQRREEVGNPLRAQVVIMNLRQLRRIQAEVFENLSFYRGAETRGGRVELRGETKVDGQDAVKLAFVHPGEVAFVRSFDRKTGRLLETEADNGATVREEGEVVVNGIRFPQRLISVTRSPGGGVVTSTITFDQIVVNEKFDSALFNVEIPGAK